MEIKTMTSPLGELKAILGDFDAMTAQTQDFEEELRESYEQLKAELL